jgi:hypothetical protein
LDKDAPLSRTVKRAGRIVCRPFLGGLHHEYVRISFPTGAAFQHEAPEFRNDDKLIADTSILWRNRF